MSNVRTTRVKLSTIMNSGAFKRGWDDYRTGAWTETWELKSPRGRPDLAPAFMYERGRTFAIYFATKTGKDLPPASKVDFSTGARLYRAAQSEGFVI